MIYETASQSFILAAALEKIITNCPSSKPSPLDVESDSVNNDGKIIHVYYTGCPQTQCLGEMNYSSKILSKYVTTLNLFHLRSLEQGIDIVSVGQQMEIDKLARRRKFDSSDSEHQNAMKMGKLESCLLKDVTGTFEDSSQDPWKIESKAFEEMSDITIENHQNVQAAREEPTENLHVPYRQRMREESSKSYEIMKEKSMDGLIIAAKQHPTNILLHLIKYLAPSRPFVVFSSYKEPLMDAYFAVKETGKAVLVTLAEAWLRNYQVLPDRTHPEVLMSGGGGYILSGIVVDNSDLPVDHCDGSSRTKSDLKRAINGGNSERKSKKFRR